jgi:uncharacterized protein (TIGR03084 family)
VSDELSTLPPQAQPEDVLRDTPKRDPQMESICDDLEAETADLLKLVVGLSPLHWDLATPAEGWTIRDTISHLAFFDETGNLAATNEDAFAASRKELMAQNDSDSAGLARGREMKPMQVLNWFISSRSNMVSNFRDLDSKARLPWYGPSMGALSFATARLMETWAHGQDVADAVGATRAPTSRLKHIAHIGVRARPFSYMINERELPPVEVAVKLKAPDGSTWTWNEDAVEQNLISGNALDFCLVVTQRRHRDDTNLVANGDAATEWIRFAQAFAGAPGRGRIAGQFGSRDSATTTD